MDVFRYVMPPIIGAVIGYCTNYIAVKMLFRPRKEIHLFGIRLPFTPGAIPKEKPRLAKKIGQVIMDYLLTEEDLMEHLSNAGIRESCMDAVAEHLKHPLESEMKMLLNQKEEDLVKNKEKITEIFTDVIMTSLSDVDIEGFVAREGTRVVKEKMKGSMFGILVGDGVIDKFAEPVGEEFRHMIEEHGEEYITSVIREKVDSFCENPVDNLLSSADISTEQVRLAVGNLYDRFIQENTLRFLQKMDFSGMISDKINEMSVEELENLVMAVMKKELNMIVNLGALIGFVLGLVNLLFLL